MGDLPGIGVEAPEVGPSSAPLVYARSGMSARRVRILCTAAFTATALSLASTPGWADSEDLRLSGTPEATSEPSPASSPSKRSQRSCEDCMRGVIGLAVGVEPGLLLRAGAEEGPPGLSLGLALVAAGFAQTKRLIYQVVLDEGGAIGWAGPQFAGDTMLSIGVRGVLSKDRVVDQGPFLRTGISAVYLANNRALARILDFPYGELGWSIATEGFGLQVAGRLGAAVVGEFSEGRRFEDRDARRQIDPAFEGGVGATLGFGEGFMIDGRYVEVWPEGVRSAIRYATARSCVTLAEVGAAKLPIGTCARAMFVRTDVEKLRDVPLGTDPWSAWSVGFVGLTVGLGGAAAGTVERFHRD